MHYFTNTNIADLYNVSKGTVTNWINGSQENKNNLQLTKVNNKFRIVKNTHNEAEIARLRQIGEIHKNKSFHSVVTPDPLFYKIFNEEQVIEIINSLETPNIIPLKFRYLNEGAKLFDKMVLDGLEQGYFPYPDKESNLLSQSLNTIQEKIKNYDKVNIIDIGPGNGLVVKDLISYLLESNKINKYIAVDLSKEMIEVCKTNLTSWFPNLNFQSEIHDIEKEPVDKICFKAKNENSQIKTINIILFLGCTISHVRDRSRVLKHFRDSLDQDDLFIFSGVFDDNIESRTESKYMSYPSNTVPFSTWIPKILGIDTKESKIVTNFNQFKQTKTHTLNLDKDYTINFNFSEYSKSITLKKGDQILIHRFYLYSIKSLVEDIVKADLKLVQTTVNDVFFITICQIDNLKEKISFDL